MRYCDYNFEINHRGLKLVDEGPPEKWERVDINRIPLEVGDTFVLELDDKNRVFFKRQPPYQTEIEFKF